MVSKIVFKFSKFLYYRFAFKKENEEKRQKILQEIRIKSEINLSLEKKANTSMKFLFDSVALNCFDIGGANELQPHWLKIHDFALFYMFEPDQRSFNDLVEKKSKYQNFKIFNLGLGLKNGIRKFYLYNEKTGSTLYDFKENYVQDFTNKYIYPIEEIEIETKSLDFVLYENQIDFINMLKLDVQGAELEILKGLTNEKVWKNIYSVELEVNFQDIYEGATTFEDVKAFFNEKEFTLFDLRISRNFDTNLELEKRIFNQYFDTDNPIPSIAAKIWEADHVYIRDLNWILSNITDYFEFKKYIIVLITYNFYYEAIKAVLEWFMLNSFFMDKKNELLKAIQTIHSNDRKNLSNFENYLSSVDYKIWSQYMEVKYPNN